MIETRDEIRAEKLIFNTDVQLINVGAQGDIHDMADFPYGLAVMVGYLRDQGFNTKLLQYPDWKKEEYIQAILDEPAYLYGFQVSFDNYPEIRNLMPLIKESNPEAKIIFGGPFVVSLYEELLKGDPYLDAVVLGEGEYTIAELIEKLKAGDPGWRDINGLAWLDDEGNVAVNPHRPGIQDMNLMPFAARDGVPDEAYDFEGKYMRDVRITTSRGCTSHCTFCAVNVNSKWQKAKQWRGRSHLNVVDEIQELVEKYNVKMVNLQDSAFDDPGKLGQQRTRLFCEEILKRGIEISMKAYFRAHAVLDDPESIELYKLYKEAGIDVLIVGAESGSDYELEIFQKDATLEDNFRAFRVLDDLDLFFVNLGLIMFGPYSTMDSVRKNIRFLHKNERCHRWQTFDSTIILTPGAVMYEWMAKENRILPRENFWEIPAYEFDDQRILSLAKHFVEVRGQYPYITQSENVYLNAANLISRLKNKMNKRIADALPNQIADFKEKFLTGRKLLNDLGYEGFIENLNRVEKDGPNAKLVSDPYYGKLWKDATDVVDQAYVSLTETIQDKGFGLGGLIFVGEQTAFQRKNTHHFVPDEISGFIPED